MLTLRFNFLKVQLTIVLCLLTLSMKTKSLTIRILYSSLIFFSFLLLHSCTPVKNVAYFENIKKDTTLTTLTNYTTEFTIRKNDILSITITSRDQASNMLFNSPQTSGSASASSGSTGTNPGYLVDDFGNINLYKLGAVHVEGLTRTELEKKLKTLLDPEYLLDAVVIVRFINKHVTILGEVGKPQEVAMPTEQLTLLDALALSGDLLITGRRDNILVIRETDLGKQFKRINLNDNSIFNSQFYYLKPNDIVYVEPTKTKVRNAGDTPQIVGYILTATSLVLTVLLNLFR